MTFLTRLKNTFQEQGVMAQIIIINIAVFLTVNIAANVSNLDLAEYLMLPLSGDRFIIRFWTLFSYMFTHVDFFHIFWNLIGFYFYCRVFFVLFTEKKLLYVYVMSGLCGGALVLLLGILFPESFGNAVLLGASAAVLGVGAVMLVYAPNYRLFLFGLIEVPYKYIYLFFFVTSTILDLASNTGGKISHIGGALFGVVYGLQLKKGRDLSDLSFLKRKNKTKLKVVSNNPNVKRQGNSPNEEATMNALLDKISKSGYDSLTKAEKELLFKLSQKK